MRFFLREARQIKNSIQETKNTFEKLKKCEPILTNTGLN